MQSLAFITPAWQRPELTEICLRQRRWVCDQLRQRYGLDATCVVIADDENLDTAAGLGFSTIVRDNRLAERFNAGYQWAHRQGVDYVFPQGSDSWLDPSYFDTLPAPGELVLSRAYNLVTANGGKRGRMWITWQGGVQWITRTDDWAHRGFRPVNDDLMRGCDSSTWNNRPEGITVRESHHHQLEYVSFQSPDPQITSYRRIMARWGTGEVTGPAVFDDLETVYRPEDVQAVRDHYLGR